MFVPKELLPTGDTGMKSVREQAEIILAHLGGEEPIDPKFVLVHASALLQYAAGMDQGSTENCEPIGSRG